MRSQLPIKIEDSVRLNHTSEIVTVKGRIMCCIDSAEYCSFHRAGRCRKQKEHGPLGRCSCYLLFISQLSDWAANMSVSSHENWHRWLQQIVRTGRCSTSTSHSVLVCEHTQLSDGASYIMEKNYEVFWNCYQFIIYPEQNSISCSFSFTEKREGKVILECKNLRFRLVLRVQQKYSADVFIVHWTLKALSHVETLAHMVEGDIMPCSSDKPL